VCDFTEIRNIEAANPAVTDLRVVQANVTDGTLTAILHWTPSPAADTVTIRYAGTPIQSSNWESAILLDDTISGSEDTYTAILPYTDGTVYFGLKSINPQGEWSPLSNNAFWPILNGYLPNIRR
jgi:hypothetical protein